MPLFIISPKGHCFFILFFEGVKKTDEKQRLHQFFLDNKKAPDKGRGQPNVFTTYSIYFAVVSIVVTDFQKY